jgi:polysaccharide biosynthesis transport protein
MDFMEYLEVFKKRKWIISIVFFAIILGGLIKLSLTIPIYESQAKLLYLPQTKSTALTNLINRENSSANGDSIRDQIQLIKTKPISDKLYAKLAPIKKIGVEDTNILDGLRITILPGTSILKLSLRHSNRVLATIAMNILTEVLVENSRQINIQKIQLAKKFIEQQLVQHEQKLIIAEKGFQKFNLDSDTFSLSNDINLLLSELSSISIESIKTMSELKAINEKYKMLKKKTAKAMSSPVGNMSRWKKELQKIPLEKMILEIRKNSFIKQKELLITKLKELSPKELEYIKLKRDLNLVQETYNILLKQLVETSLEEAAQIASIRIVEPAIISRKPVYPDVAKFRVLIILLAFVISLSVVIIVEMFDSNLRNKEEIIKTTGWKLIGTVPYEKSEELLLISNYEPSAGFVESYRTIRTNIHYSNEAAKSKSILISSCLSCEGKTTTVVNMALTYAGLGLKVVIVDADMRKPSIHKYFGIDNVHGLSSILVDNKPYKDVIKNKQGLSIITAGPISNNPINIIESENFSIFFESLKKDFDLVIFDAPPLVAVSESYILAKKTGLFVLVVDQGICSKKILENVSNNITSLGIDVSGCIVNKYAYYSYPSPQEKS